MCVCVRDRDCTALFAVKCHTIMIMLLWAVTNKTEFEVDAKDRILLIENVFR